MEVRPSPPIDGQRNTRAEGDHVVVRDGHERLAVGLMELHRVKSGHDHVNDTTQHNHHRREAGSEPAEEAVPAYLADAHQTRLRDEEDHPGGECGAMHPEQRRPWRSGMEEIGTDSSAE